MIQQGLLTLMLCLLPIATLAADLTQREWMEQLVASLGWEYGLPDKPQDADYIRLLSGERNLRIEAETDHRETDRVAVKHYTNYGEYSGSGWISGTRKPTKIHFDILLRHSGRYQLAVAARMPGVTIELAGRELVTVGDDFFARHELGSLVLAAGQAQIVVTLPPNAGIDYLELSAPAMTKISPLAGWQPAEPIQKADLALTCLQVLDLITVLPPTKHKLQIELEMAPKTAGVSISSARHLGVPSSYSWLRTGNQPALVEMPVTVPEAACYQLSMRGSSDQPTGIQFGNYFSKEIRFGHALSSQELGSYCLPRGTLNLELELPAWAGADLFELRKYDTSAASLALLLGLSSEQQLLDQQVINELLELVSGMIH